MKAALVCTAAGQAYRGLERFSLELFELMQHELPVTLFGSNSRGKSGAVGLPCLKYDGWISKLKGKVGANYYLQQFSYALSFIPVAALGGYDLIHYSEPAMGNFLYHAKKWFGLKYKILFTNWGIEGPYCFRPDHLQEITYPAFQKTISSGVPSNRVTFLPYGLNSEALIRNGIDRNHLREKFQVPKDKIVILSVAALNRRHKRIDYLIREVAKLNNDFFLLVVGDREEPELMDLGCELLGERFKSLYVPFDQMPEIYHLADLFVISSLIEGFCLALAEAMCAGLPVIAHDSPHFQWMIQEPNCLADLSREGNLAQKIKEIMSNHEKFQKLAGQNQLRAAERFDWQRLKAGYLNLYERTLSNGS